MLVGVMMRSFKNYSSLEFVPVSYGEKFTTYAGRNGVGKSAVLEAMDCFFNNKSFNVGRNYMKAREEKRYPFVCLFMALKKEDVSSHPIVNDLEILNNSLRTCAKEKKEFEQLEKVFNSFDYEKYYISCVTSYPDSSIEDNEYLFSSTYDNLLSAINGKKSDKFEFLKKINLAVKELYDYLYVPLEANDATFLNLQDEAISKIIGNDILDMINEKVAKEGLNQGQIKKAIRNGLSNVLTTLNKGDSQYEYTKSPNSKDLFSWDDIVLSFLKNIDLGIYLFEERRSRSWLPISSLSAGEKKRALVENIVSLLSKRKNNQKKLIIAIDEPEASLDTINVFQQYKKLYEMSAEVQILVTTHWYGFIPVVQEGRLIYLQSNDTGAPFVLADIDLSKTRDEIRKFKDRKGEESQNIKLLEENASNWIFCEGITDKIYLDSFLKIKKVENVNVLPLSGAPEVLRFCKAISFNAYENKHLLSGKVMFLIDTDNAVPEKENISTVNLQDEMLQNKVAFRRIVKLASKEIELGNEKDRRTGEVAIEGVLVRDKFLTSLAKIMEKDDYDKFSWRSENLLSTFLLNNDDDREKLESFFKANLGENKIKLANEYVTDLKKEDVPDWFNDIISFFKNEGK